MAADRAAARRHRDRARARARGLGGVRPLRPSSLVYQGVVRDLGVDIVEQSARSPPQVSSPTSSSCSTCPTRSPTARPRRADESDRLEREGARVPRVGARRVPRPRARRVAGCVVDADGGVDRLPNASATRSRRSWQDDGHGGNPITGPASPGRTARSCSCSAPRPGRCTPTSSSVLAARASRKRRGASPPRSSRTDDDERSWDLVAAGRAPRRRRDRPAGHADPRRGRPGRSSTRCRGARSRASARSSMLFDAERLRLNEAAANKLLKTLEEPPPRAVIVLVTSGADQLLPTIRSRCQRVDFAYLGADAVARRARRATGVARRTRRPPRAARRRSPRSRPRARRPPRPGTRRVRRRGASRRRHRGRGRRGRRSWSRTRCRTALAGLEAAQAEETEQLDAELEAAGYPDRTRRAQLRRLEERHKRAHCGARGSTLLLEGITALETVYRDAWPGRRRALNIDRDGAGGARPRAAARRTRRVPRRPARRSPSSTRTRPCCVERPVPPPPRGRWRPECPCGRLTPAGTLAAAPE